MAVTPLFDENDRKSERPVGKQSKEIERSLS